MGFITDMIAISKGKTTSKPIQPNNQTFGESFSKNYSKQGEIPTLVPLPLKAAIGLGKAVVAGAEATQQTITNTINSIGNTGEKTVTGNKITKSSLIQKNKETEVKNQNLNVQKQMENTIKDMKLQQKQIKELRTQVDKIDNDLYGS